MAKLKGLFFSLGAVDLMLYVFVGLAIWFLAADVDPVRRIKDWMASQLLAPSDGAGPFAVEMSR
jgi:hypothetical protein